MIVYHGSSDKIEAPSVNFSKRYLDFGRGFYLTTYHEQAERWAKRKRIRKTGRANINVYELDEDFSNFHEKIFTEDAEEWVEFVCACRRGGDIYKKYDIIIGSVANDEVYTVVDMYYKGLWDMERTLRELRFHEVNDQICIVNQSLIDQNLRFTRCYEVSL
jgi:hypothetical protein